MPLVILRTLFVAVAVALGAYFSSAKGYSIGSPIGIFLCFLLTASAIVFSDSLIKRKRIDLISSVYFGLLIGLILTFIVGLVLTPLFQSYDNLEPTGEEGIPGITGDQLRILVLSLVGIVMCYSCISLLWQTKDDFRFLIPYVEFSKDIKGLKPYVLDTSVVIDGRIADIVETGVIDNQLIMPRFVLGELQNIADSGDKMRRARGRRGLDVLDRLRKAPQVDFKVYDRDLPEMEGQPVDMKLLLLARHLEGKVVTGDFNLNKVAKLHNVPVINLNEIANSLKPVFLPGESVRVKVVKAGESPGQGVGYLDDGTMIVIEDGRNHIGEDIMITVTSMLQTSAGRMVFGKYEG